MADDVQELFSEDRQHKAVITLRQDKLYGVVLYEWTHEIVSGYGEVAAFWAEVERPSLTDTLANAPKLAEESLQRYVHGFPRT